MRRILAALMAASLALTTAGLAAADTTVSETATILSAMSCTGAPASIAYGNVTPGAPSTAQTFSLSCTANVNWRVDFTGTAFTGPGTLTKDAREMQVTGLVNSGTNVAAWTSFGSANFDAIPGIGTPEFFGNAGTGTGTIGLRLNPPAATTPGSYTGSFTFGITAS